MAYQHILYDSHDGVGHITLNRPDKLNALGLGPGSSRDEIAQALAAADADPAVGAILITAAGRAFCAGGDLGGAKSPETPFEEHLQGEQIDEFLAAVSNTHKPIVAGVQGLCIGAALGFIARCDLVIAADDARFGLVEGRIGLPGATEIVPLVGAAWAKFMILTGEMIDAARAAEIGLILVAVPPDELAEKARDLAARIARLPRESVQLNKAAIDKITEASGRHAGWLAARPMDTIIRSMSRHAKAPDGRLFAEILKTEGVEGMKGARETQFKGPWLPPRETKKS